MADRRDSERRRSAEPGALRVFERRLLDRRSAARDVGRRAADLGGGSALLLCGIAATEALVAVALLLGWLPGALLLHVPLCAGTLAIRRMDPQPAGWQGAVLRATVAVLPVLGPVAALAGLVALVAGAPKGLRVAPGPAPEDPLEARLEAIAGAPSVPDGLLMEALVDVLRWGTPAQKARALDLAARALRPGGEALLRLALGDPDPAVRNRAEQLRPAVEQRLVATIDTLRGRARRDGAAGRRALARHLDRAAFSGLLDPARADACRAEAAGLWKAIAEAMPEDAEAQAALGRDLLALGDLRAARAALEAALSRGIATAAVIGWLAECLYRLRDFAAMDALVAGWRPALEADSDGGGALSAAWRLWLAASPNASVDWGSA